MEGQAPVLPRDLSARCTLRTVIEAAARPKSRRPGDLGRDDGVGGGPVDWRQAGRYLVSPHPAGETPATPTGGGVPSSPGVSQKPLRTRAPRSPSRANQRSRPTTVPAPESGSRSRTMVTQTPVAPRADADRLNPSRRPSWHSQLDGDHAGAATSTTMARGQPGGRGFRAGERMGVAGDLEEHHLLVAHDPRSEHHAGGAPQPC